MSAELPAQLEAADPLIGTVIDGRFRVDAFLARGGMGKVYRATQLGLGRKVAVKVLDARAAADLASDFEMRFVREAEVAAGLSHPNTLRIHDYGRLDTGAPYLVMELLTGRTLAEIFAEGPVEPLRLLHIVRQACGSLAEAHEQGVVHRDLKPSNLFMVPEADGSDFVKVLDFGLVKRLDDDVETTRAGVLLGSPLYMSPEQVQGAALDSRSDIYALGVVLYMGLTGRSPFSVSQVSALLVAHVNEAPRPLSEVAPQLPEVLQWTVHRCLEKEPERRFLSMRELSRALSACAMELRGEVSDVRLALREGCVVAPSSLELSLAATIPTSVGGGVWVRRSSRVFGVALGVGALAVAVASLVIALSGRHTVVQEPVPAPAPVVEPVAPPAVPVVHGPRSIVITTTPESAAIERDGRFVGNGRAVLTLDTDSMADIAVRAAGFFTRQLELDGEASEVHIQLDREPRPVSAPVEEASADPPEPVADEPAEALPIEPLPEPTPAPEPPAETWQGGDDLRDPWGRNP